MPEIVQSGYVKTPDGQWFVQLPARNRTGFVLADSDQTWEFPPVRKWELVAEADVPQSVKEDLGWLLQQTD